MILAITLFLFQRASWAFPEMVRHHYVNCNSCHVNPSGGGVLNEYGRGMASEVLSTWNYENEALFLHGAIKPEKMPKGLQLGGDVRALQVHRETSKVREGRYILMQSHLEAAYTIGPVTGVLSYGKADRENHIQSGVSRFYLLALATDTLQIKAGRFVPSFGLNLAHHALPTRQALGFGYESERDGLEAHWSAEQWHIAFGTSKARLKSALRDEERSALLQVEKFFADSYRLGVSIWNGESDRQKRWITSAHGIFGFSENLYLLSELAWQSKRSKPGDREEGVFQFNRLGYELTKGVHLLALQDYSKSDLSNPMTQTLTLGIGALWYPRPHFELEIGLHQRKIRRSSNDFEDYAYLMAHYYL